MGHVRAVRGPIPTRFRDGFNQGRARRGWTWLPALKVCQSRNQPPSRLGRIPRRVGDLHHQVRRLSRLQPDPSCTAGGVVDGQSVRRDVMEPVHLISLRLPHGIKRMGVHVLVDRKIQHVDLEAMVHQHLAGRFVTQRRLHGSNPTHVGCPIQQIVGLHPKPKDARNRDGICATRKPRQRPFSFHPQLPNHGSSRVWFVHPTIKRIQRALRACVPDLKMQVRPSTSS